jgi:hypothetical protein
MGRPARAADAEEADQPITLATLLSTPLILVPTLRIATIAATAISEAITVYSMAVAPSSFIISRRKMDRIVIPKKKKFLTGVTHRPTAWDR